MMASDVVPHKYLNFPIRNSSPGMSKTLHESGCRLGLLRFRISLSAADEIYGPARHPLKLCNAAEQKRVFEALQFRRCRARCETAPDEELIDDVDRV